MSALAASRQALGLQGVGHQRSIEAEWLIIHLTDAKYSRIESERHSGKVLTVVRQSNPPVGPMPQRHLTDHPVTGQVKAQPQLLSEVPVRDTQFIRFGSSCQSKAEVTLHQTVLE